MNWRRFPLLLMVAAVFSMLGFALREWERRVTIHSASADSRGTSANLAVLGGFRAVAADFLWLRANAMWERRDYARLQTNLRLVTSIDPRPVTFWLNGARMIAYDAPEWRIEQAGGRVRLPPDFVSRITAEHARAALGWLRDARRIHPESVALALEQADIELLRLGDESSAVVTYRHAAGLPGATSYAERRHAQLLRRLGRGAEAYDYLVELHVKLRTVDVDAAALLLARIRTLEDELGIPVDAGYVGRNPFH